jgi:putative FmdB family regulatory protein
MKTFDYQCVVCGFIFTFLQDKLPPSHCPKCTGFLLTRLISAPRAINYNGPGTARFRRGLKCQKPSPRYPLYCDEDLE